MYGFAVVTNNWIDAVPSRFSTMQLTLMRLYRHLNLRRRLPALKFFAWSASSCHCAIFIGFQWNASVNRSAGGRFRFHRKLAMHQLQPFTHAD
jgi:hypothetical protein